MLAVCDIDPAKAKAAAAKFEASPLVHGSGADAGEQNLGLVDIVTRMDTHRDLVELAVRHGTPTIVQKPIAPTLGDARAMIAAADANASSAS
jgi:predicted dehydrogenase